MTGAVVELFGPPGVGKSSVARHLADRGGAAVVASLRPPDRRRSVAAGLRALPMVTAAVGTTEPMKVIRLLARAHAGAAPAGAAEVTIIDQGPIYTLARLEVAGVAWRGRLDRWRSARLDAIADQLRAAVHLTCGASEAVRRIERRSKSHPAERHGRPLVEAYERAFDLLAVELTRRGLPVGSVATDEGTEGDVAAAVWRTITAVTA